MNIIENKILYKAVMDSGEGFCVAGADFNIIFVNNAFKKMYGYQDNEAAGQSFFKVVFADEGEASLIRGCVFDESCWQGRVMSFTKNGREFPVSLCINALYDENGCAEAYSVNIKDISEIFKKEDELSQSKRFLKFALDSLQTQVIILDENGVIIHFNEAFKKFGKKYKDLSSSWVGLNYLEMVDEEAFSSSGSAAKAAAGIRDIIRGNKEIFGMEYHFENNGVDMWFIMTAVRFKEIIPPRYVISFENITERKIAETEIINARLQAESANKAKTRFLAGMSHEIRTPMNTILGYVQYLLREKTLSPRQYEYIEIIGQSGRHLLGLINEVLDMSKIEAGRMVLAPEDTDLYALINDIKNMFITRAEDRGIYLEFEVDESLPQYVYADGRKIRQVIINIVGNAVKFTETGGIKVSARRQSDIAGTSKSTICIEVRDTGCGISKEDIDKVFEVFGQAAAGEKCGAGTGLGMPLSLGYARLMDGDITVESEPGVGSVFKFTFKAEPLSNVVNKTLGRQTRRVTGIAGNARPPLILIVDDVASNRKVLRLLLEPAGFSVIEATDGQDALSVIAQSMPDAVFMDRYMPFLDGIEASRIIKMSDKCRNLPILMLSASSLEENRGEAISAGVSLFLRKPFVEEEIFECLKKTLGIDYKYEEIAGVVTPVEADAVITAQIKSLPPEIKDEITAAANNCDVSKLRQIMSSRSLKSLPELTSKIEGLLIKYEYDKIAVLINQN